jgi:hypothetical protein
MKQRADERAMSILRSQWMVACIALLAAQLPTMARAASWHQAQTADFHVISAVGLKQTRGIIEDVELFQAAMQKALTGKDIHPKLPATIFLLDNALWNRYVPLQRGVAGVVFVHPSAIHIVVNADTWLAAAPIVYHELTHVILQQNARGLRLPVWYSEGYADFFSTIKKKHESIELGLAPWWRWVDLKMQPWMPLRQVLDMSRSSPEYKKERLAATFYAASWLMIHYGVFQNPERGKQIERYRLLLSSGFSQQSAFEQAFPGDAGEFESELKSYAHQTKFKYYTLKGSDIAPAQAAAIVPMAEPAALDELAGWMLAADFTSDEQLKLVQKLAADAAPSSVAALQLAAFHAHRREHDRAQVLVEKGCGPRLANLRIAMLCGDVYLDRARDGNEELTSERRAALVLDARRYYEAVLQSQPDNIEGLLSMAYTAEFAPLAGDQVREGLERIWQRSIRNSEIAYAIATLYGDGDLGQCKLYLEQAMFMAEDQEMERRMLSVLQSVEAQIANRSR